MSHSAARPGVEFDAGPLRRDISRLFHMSGACKLGRVRCALCNPRRARQRRHFTFYVEMPRPPSDPALSSMPPGRQRFLTVHFDRSIREWDASLKKRDPVRQLDTEHTQAITAVAVDMSKCVMCGNQKEAASLSSASAAPSSSPVPSQRLCADMLQGQHPEAD